MREFGEVIRNVDVFIGEKIHIGGRRGNVRLAEGFADDLMVLVTDCFVHTKKSPTIIQETTPNPP